jgi:photosynthetic reaction center cytochrome c subunit
MVKRSQLLALLIITASLCAVGLSTGTAQEKTTEQVYKNIQVLKGVPAAQLDAVMASFTGSLGVRCNHCHVPGQFEKDDKPAKQTARKMIRMVFELNRGSFDGRGAVTCVTCHRGQTRPANVPPLGQSLWLPPDRAAKQEPALPGVEQILERYVQASGGRQAVERVTSRVWKGSRVGADGVLVPEEVYAKAPNKLLTITSYPNMVFRTGYDGARGWALSNQGARDIPPEMLAQLRREAEFYKETRLKEIYSKLSVVGRETVGGREAYVVEAAPADGGSPEKLFFDVETGLLVRKYTEVKTVLGQFPTQTDYEDYREVDGVRLPFNIRWSIPGRTWGRKITEVRQNVPLDDAQFNPPAR